MASPVYDSKIVRPIVHSLLHLASVKVAITLCHDFHYVNLFGAMFHIKRGATCPPSNIEDSRAQQSLLLIPVGVRGAVMATIRSLNVAALKWKSCHKLKDDFTFYWKSDGTIDGSKTVQHLILKTNINIRARFYLACYYCLEENIQSLWTEMVADGQTGNLATDTDSMVRFWVKRMSNKPLLPWRQCVQEFFKDPQNCHNVARFSTFFPSLQPEDRKRFLGRLQFAHPDDFLLCLYATTKEEEEVLLKEDPLKVLRAYLDCPLRNIFLETVKQMWKYINITEFHFLLELFFFEIAGENIDYQDLFESFWESSPILLREFVRKIPDISEKIDSCLNETRGKRKALFDELSISKKRKKIETQMKA